MAPPPPHNPLFLFPSPPPPPALPLPSISPSSRLLLIKATKAEEKTALHQRSYIYAAKHPSTTRERGKTCARTHTHTHTAKKAKHSLMWDIKALVKTSTNL